MGIGLHGVNIQAVLKTISKLVVEEGEVEFSLLHSLLDA